MIVGTRPMSEAQKSYILGLAEKRDLEKLDGLQRDMLENVWSEKFVSTIEASNLIEHLKNLPFKPNPAQVGFEHRMVYINPTGVYFVKKSAKGNYYASKLTNIPAERLTEDDHVVKFEFEYGFDHIAKINPLTDKVTVETARSLSIKYGVCVICHRKLKAAKSVAANLGPVCEKRCKH